jgi:hypothetical protein
VAPPTPLTREEVGRALGVSRATVERAAAGGPLVLTLTGHAAPCMNCWADSAALDGQPGSRAARYARLLAVRDARAVACSPEQQAGGTRAAECARCARRTVHQVTGECVLCRDDFDDEGNLR